MLTTPAEWQMLNADAQLARVNDVERDHNLLRGFVNEPRLEPLPVTTADEWALLPAELQYQHLIELELGRDNLRDYIRTFYDGGAVPIQHLDPQTRTALNV